MQSRRPVVLLVDDHDDGRQALAEYLALDGLAVHEAASPGEALHRCANVAVAVVDVVMPGMSGVELARRMRLQPCGPGWIIGISGAVLVMDPPANGFDEFFQKPVPLVELAAHVRNHMTKVR